MFIVNQDNRTIVNSEQVAEFNCVNLASGKYTNIYADFSERHCFLGQYDANEEASLVFNSLLDALLNNATYFKMPERREQKRKE